MRHHTKQFLQDFRSGDAAVFGRLVDLHSNGLRRYAERYARDSDEIDDLLCATWSIAWEKRLQFKGHGPVIGWLIRICRSVALRVAKDQRMHVRLSDCIEFVARPECGEALARDRDAFDDSCLNAVMALPDRRRLTIICRVLFGLSVEETALLMQCRPGTVKAALHAALSTLRTSAGPWSGTAD